MPGGWRVFRRRRIWFVEGGFAERVRAWGCIVDVAAKHHGRAVIDAYPNPYERGVASGEVRNAYDHLVRHRAKRFRDPLMAISLDLDNEDHAHTVKVYGPCSIAAEVVVDPILRAGMDDEAASLWIEAPDEEIGVLEQLLRHTTF